MRRAPDEIFHRGKWHYVRHLRGDGENGVWSAASSEPGHRLHRVYIKGTTGNWRIEEEHHSVEPTVHAENFTSLRAAQVYWVILFGGT